MSIKAIELNKNLSKLLSDKKRTINKDTLKSICRIGEGQDTCRYIMRNKDDYVCIKNSIIQISIDENVEKGGMVARGNNCSGLITKEEIINGKEKGNQEKIKEKIKEEDPKEENKESSKEENSKEIF